MWITILTILLPLLAQLLKHLLQLKGEGRSLHPSQSGKVDRVLWYCDQITQVAPTVGCVKGGIRPPLESSTEDDDRWI